MVEDDLSSRLDRLRRENQELRAAVQARDDFIAIAAHELRNPMTPLIAQVEILRNLARQHGSAIPERLSNGLERLDRIASQYMKRATTLLDISRLTSGRFGLEPARLDASGLVREAAEAIAPYAARAGCALSLAIEDNLVGVGDRLALEQITDNLLSNAIKYGAGKPIHLALARDAAGLHLSVRDHGIGISEEDKARIFARFERAVAREHTGGFGVGLWVVGQLVAIMGGAIAISSQPGEGSTFTVRLPFNPAAEEQ